MKQNVLSWLTADTSDARHAIILTHNVSFQFIESKVLPLLRDAGSPRLTILADATCAAASWRAERRMLGGLGNRYRVVPMELGPMRRFHPKALFLATKEKAALAVGSGNLTWGGMAANHEVWATARSGEPEAPMIAAFRAYLASIVQFAPTASAVEAAVGAAFDSELPWVGALPAAGLLFGSPADASLLDRIGPSRDEVRAVSVVAPYHDDAGTALETLARRYYPVPVSCYLQAGHEGLSAAAAAELPDNVRLVSMDTKSEKPSFVHAKFIAFHLDSDVRLALGSANCSQAALLAGEGWGNAELMSVRSVSREQAAELMGEITELDAPPRLPEVPPSDEWPEADVPAFRIHAARQLGDELEVSYSAPGPIQAASVIAPEGTWFAEAANADGLLRFVIPVRLRTIQLTGTTADGQQLVSEEMWIDDEESLSAWSTARRLVDGLSQANGRHLDPGRFTGLMNIFREYLCDPEARRWPRRGERPEAVPPPYNPMDVFADGFGVGVLPAGAPPREASILAIIAALFGGQGQPRPPEENAGDNLPEDVPDGEPAAPEEPQGERQPLTVRERAQVLRAVESVMRVLADPAFVTGRNPRLLGADIALLALLLVKAHADGLIEREVFQDIARSIWKELFFGDDGKSGHLLARFNAVADDQERGAAIAQLASPLLSAALALWCVPEWRSDDAEGRAFRLAAGHLHQRYSWIFAGANQVELAAEVRRFAETLLPLAWRADAEAVWVEAVQLGEALRLLQQRIDFLGVASLRQHMRSAFVGPTDLVWADGLARPTQRTAYVVKAKIVVVPVGRTEVRRYLGSHVLPLSEVLEQNLLDLPPAATLLLASLAAEAPQRPGAAWFVAATSYQRSNRQRSSP